MLEGGQSFPLLQNAQNGTGTHPASYFLGTVGYFCGGSSWGVNLTIHLQHSPRLEMSCALQLQTSRNPLRCALSLQ